MSTAVCLRSSYSFVNTVVPVTFCTTLALALVLLVLVRALTALVVLLGGGGRRWNGFGRCLLRQIFGLFTDNVTQIQLRMNR